MKKSQTELLKDKVYEIKLETQWTYSITHQVELTR